jgi:hypothetical protein
VLDSQFLMIKIKLRNKNVTKSGIFSPLIIPHHRQQAAHTSSRQN